METQSFPIINDDETHEIHSVFYLTKDDKENLLFALNMALDNPKTKFSKRFSYLQELRKQIKHSINSL